MNQEEIIKQNKLIAEFMGEKIDLSKFGENWKRIINQYTTNEIPNYHSDWGWLMPVVEKIGNTIIPKEWLNAGWNLSVHYSIHSVGTSFEIGDHDRHISDSGIEAKMWDNISKEPIIRTWLAVIEFIKWYNEQKLKHETGNN